MAAVKYVSRIVKKGLGLLVDFLGRLRPGPHLLVCFAKNFMILHRAGVILRVKARDGDLMVLSFIRLHQSRI